MKSEGKAGEPGEREVEGAVAAILLLLMLLSRVGRWNRSSPENSLKSASVVSSSRAVEVDAS